MEKIMDVETFVKENEGVVFDAVSKEYGSYKSMYENYELDEFEVEDVSEIRDDLWEVTAKGSFFMNSLVMTNDGLEPDGSSYGCTITYYVERNKDSSFEIVTTKNKEGNKTVDVTVIMDSERYDD